MTRIEELEKIAQNNNHRWFLYYQSCQNLAFALHVSLQRYLGITPDDLLFVPTIGEYDPAIEYTISGALRMGDDSFFHIGLQFTLLGEPVLIPFKIKTIPEDLYEEHEIGIEDQDKVFKTHGFNPEDLTPVCEYVFELIKTDIDQSLERWLKQGGTPAQSTYAFYRPCFSEEEPYLPFHLPERETLAAARPTPHWITTEEAVQISGYHPEYVRRLARQGKIGAVRKGRDWWIDRNALQEYLKDKESLTTRKSGPERPFSP
ncbi:MAG TPA: DNA-binding protein [Anaerolineae bacterium]|nr:DNA-binding protein [Anaerolineae bacterium]